MTTTVSFDDLVTTVAREQQAAFRSHYRHLARLPKSAADLQAFLDAYLEHVVDLYAATAGAIWFRTPDGDQLTWKTQVAFERLGIEKDLAAPHQRLLQFATTRRRSFLVKPFSAPARQAAVSNPTDSFLVLGPVVHNGESLAVVELALGPTPLRGRTAAERNRYVLWLDHLLGFLCEGIELRFLRKAAPLAPALKQLSVAAQSAAETRAAIMRGLEQQLAVFSGWSFGSLEDNQSFTANVHELLDQHGLRVSCPQCGHPAILRCQNAGNAKAGVFLYDHTLDTGRTFHGGPTTFPPLTLVPRPQRRKRDA